MEKQHFIPEFLMEGTDQEGTNVITSSWDANYYFFVHHFNSALTHSVFADVLQSVVPQNGCDREGK